MEVSDHRVASDCTKGRHEEAGLRVDGLLRRRLHDGGKPRDDLGIELVGLGQLAAGLGEIPNLPGVDHGYG